MNIKFKDLQASCKHQGWIKAGGIKMCSYKDRHPAQCWDDWQECKRENCPLSSTKAAGDIKGQLTIRDLWGELA